MPKAVDEKNFDDEVSKGLVLVDFWAAWCPPCRALAPIMEDVDKESKDAKVLKVDVDSNQNLAMKYQVSGIPTVKLFKDGNEVESFVGLMPKQSYLEAIEKHA